MFDIASAAAQSEMDVLEMAESVQNRIGEEVQKFGAKMSEVAAQNSAKGNEMVVKFMSAKQSVDQWWNVMNKVFNPNNWKKDDKESKTTMMMNDNGRSAINTDNDNTNININSDEKSKIKDNTFGLGVELFDKLAPLMKSLSEEVVPEKPKPLL